MTAGPVDLRSDTVTKPSVAMRAAMASAEVGDDCYGEDPTVARLERMIADALGFNAALFMPTGVMANHLAVRLLVAPGQELLCDADSHLLMHEGGAAAWHGGVQTRTTVSSDGVIRADHLRRLTGTSAPFGVDTRAVLVENTHNRAGGRVFPLNELRAVRDVASQAGIAVHCDGARLWNAHVRSEVPLLDYGKCFDTVAVCLSKGLGAPVGSVLAFDDVYLDEARVMRHRMGGSMRQSGVIAAAGIYGFQNNIERIVDDHANAQLIAGMLVDAGVSVQTPETNIVLVETPDAAATVSACAAVGVKVAASSLTQLRLVTHLDVDKEQCTRAAEAIARALAYS